MIRDRLKELNIKITELAEYLQISRPTLYKFIESFDDGDKTNISSGIVGLFNYIEKSELIDKRNVVNYIIQNLSDSGVTENNNGEKTLEALKKYLSDEPDDKKIVFIQKYLKSSRFDQIIDYALEVEKLLRKKKLTTEDIKYLQPYKEIVAIKNKED